MVVVIELVSSRVVFSLRGFGVFYRNRWRGLEVFSSVVGKVGFEFSGFKFKFGFCFDSDMRYLWLF